MMRIQSLLFAGLVAVCFAFAAVGCKDDEPKSYDCDEGIEILYDENCEMWCGSDGSTIYLDTCGWYDDGDPANFDDGLAEDICYEIQDRAEEEGCEAEYQSVVNCAVRDAEDCVNSCDDQADEFGDCMNW